MDAIEYVKALHRLCENQDCYFGRATECPLLNKGDKKDGYCIANISGCEEKAVQIVEQWAKDNPIKTRQSEFLRIFPSAMINRSDGILCISPCSIEGERMGCTNGKSCGDCRRDYWLTEVTDNGND